jgi:type III pantothenate kinase
MYILGDIGNTETKIFIISLNNKIIRKLNISTKDINQKNLMNCLVILKLIIKRLKRYSFVVWCQNHLI